MDNTRFYIRVVTITGEKELLLGEEDITGEVAQKLVSLTLRWKLQSLAETLRDLIKREMQ